MLKIPAEFEDVTKGGSPRKFKEICRCLGIDPKMFGGQTSMAEAIRRSFGVSENTEPPEVIEDLREIPRLQGCPMTRTKVQEKGILGYRYESFYGESVFVPLTTEPADV